MSEYFTRDEFVKPIRRRYREFDASLNGTTKKVRIQSLTALERSRYELANLSDRGLWNRTDTERMSAKLVSMCVVDSAGNRILNDDDVKSLIEQDGAFIGEIFDECMEHTGLRVLGTRKLAKNSEGGGETETPAD